MRTFKQKHLVISSPIPATASADLSKLPTLRSLFENEGTFQFSEKSSPVPSPPPDRHPTILARSPAEAAAAAMANHSRFASQSARRKRNGRAMASSLSAGSDSRHSRTLSCGRAHRRLEVPQSTLSMTDGGGSSSSSCLSSNRELGWFDAAREAFDVSAPDNQIVNCAEKKGNGGYGASPVDESEDWGSDDDWKLQAQILAAECKLLRAEKELLQRKCGQGYVEMVGGDDGGVALDYSVGSSNDMRCLQASSSCSTTTSGKSCSMDANSFAQEAAKRLHHQQGNTTSNSTVVSSTSDCEPRVEEEDPTDALQHRLQNLLLSSYPPFPTDGEQPAGKRGDVVDGHDNPVDSHKLRSIARASMLPSGLRQIQELPASSHSWRSRLMCSDLADVSVDSSFIRVHAAETSASSSGNLSHQTLAEEMYCKTAIRRMVEQVQAEAEHWSQVQEIVQSLQEEMGGLIREREQWEDRALRAEAEIASLKDMVHEWKNRAKSAQEESASLRTERKILRFELQAMKQQQEMHKAPCVPSTSTDVGDQKANAVNCCEEAAATSNRPTTQEVHYPVCDSFAHSRNDSTRSSVDLGNSSQRSFSKNLKKLLDFSTIGSSSSSNAATKSGLFRSHHHQRQANPPSIPKLGDEHHHHHQNATKDANHDHHHQVGKSYKPIDLPKVLLRNMENMESARAMEPKERKKARLLSNKENLGGGGGGCSSAAKPQAKMPWTAGGAPAAAAAFSGSRQIVVGSDGFYPPLEEYEAAAGDGSRGPPPSMGIIMKSPTPIAPAPTPSRIPFSDMAGPSMVITL